MYFNEMTVNKGKQVRHYKDLSELRTKRVQIRLTKDEYAILKDLAEENGTSDSRIVIEALKRYFAIIQKKPPR